MAVVGHEVLPALATASQDRNLPAGPVMVHFRSETAQLSGGDQPANGALTLRGQITQTSYPGEVYRYAVQVGDQIFMVDDKRRLDVGTAVGITLPPEALHVYPASAQEFR